MPFHAACQYRRSTVLPTLGSFTPGEPRPLGNRVRKHSHLGTSLASLNSDDVKPAQCPVLITHSLLQSGIAFKEAITPALFFGKGRVASNGESGEAPS